jgi:uncharacterized Zn-binding protein involved in type VI secretion
MLDPTNHPGLIVTGIGTVLIAGLPAAVVGNNHVCFLPPNAGPHPTTPLVSGSATVHIGGKPAGRTGDQVACGAVITKGAPTVLIGG